MYWFKGTGIDIFLRIFLLLGLYFFVSNIFSLLYLIYRKFLIIGRDLPSRYGTGSYAFIMGGADGIGRAYGFELARRGFNIILCDSQKAQVKNTMNEIKQTYPKINARFIVADMSKSYDKATFDYIMQEITDLDISMLINCSMSYFGQNLEMIENLVRDSLMMNLLAPIMMARKLIGRLAKRQYKSAIINVLPQQDFTCLPGNITLCGIKNFLMEYNKSLLLEIGKGKVDFLTVEPGMLCEKPEFLQRFYCCTPEQSARSSLKNLGRTNFTYGNFRHEISLGLGKYNLFKYFMKRQGGERKLGIEKNFREGEKPKVE